MSSVITVTNTIAFVFPDSAAQPTLPEMARFVKNLNGPREHLDSAYKNPEEKAILIKYKSEKGMADALSLNSVRQKFTYSNGIQVEVCMTEAGGNTQYIRVFDLPPEVPDSILAAELGKFGKIKRCVREKYPPELHLDLFTGVRGVYMDVESQIPPALLFCNRRGRIFYRGNKLICFACGQEGHLKKSCGKGKVKQTVAAVGEEAQRNTFAAVLAGSSSKNKSTSSHGMGDRVEQEEQPKQEEEEEAIGIASSTSNAVEMEKNKILDVEVSDEKCQMGATTTGETVMAEGNEGKQQKWFRFQDDPIYIRAKEIQRQQEAKEAEEQRQQRKKASSRTKTESVSPPVKKKY